jgi:hypothetical protein
MHTFSIQELYLKACVSKPLQIDLAF